MRFNEKYKILKVLSVIFGTFCILYLSFSDGFAQKKSQNVTPTTSAEARKKQEAAEREIKQTEEQLRRNERSVRLGLTELGKLEADISVNKKKISELNAKINGLAGKITGLETDISKNESELGKLREEYLKAVKKMRIAKKNNSDLAFIFASDNFNQAVRRMRYLKEFREWKDRQSSEIDSKITLLKSQKDELSKAKDEENKALIAQKAANSTIEKQYIQQNALVAELKKNGEALKIHLSKKQSEANDLKNRVSQLIAEEQRKAAEEKARIEAQRREEELRKAEEQRKAEERENQLLAESNNKGNSIEENLTTAKSSSSKSKTKTKENEKNDKKDTARRRKTKDKNTGSTENKNIASVEAPKNYADARKRTPRSNNTVNVSSAQSGATSFEGMKGKLPYPVAGPFRLTSSFGQQTLPDLPDVMYDNPGIDAEVNRGASAIAVYEGKVSGVYMIPGYNTVVIVNHGNYYTVYGNISSPSVKVGDMVSVGQGLGLLAAQEDDDTHGSIHFEVWRNREKLNPQEWLK